MHQSGQEKNLAREKASQNRRLATHRQKQIKRQSKGRTGIQKFLKPTVTYSTVDLVQCHVYLYDCTVRTGCDVC